MSEPSLEQRVEILKRKAEQKRRTEEAEAFNPKAAIVQDEIITVNDPQLGLVKLGRLKQEDLLEHFEFMNQLSRAEYTTYMVYLCVKKAYPDFSWEDFKKLRLDVSTRLMNLARLHGFLPQAPGR